MKKTRWVTWNELLRNFEVQNAVPASLRVNAFALRTNCVEVGRGGMLHLANASYFVRSLLSLVGLLRSFGVFSMEAMGVPPGSVLSPEPKKPMLYAEKMVVFY